MIHKYLKQLSKIELNFNKKIKYNKDGTQIINTAIFKKDFFDDYNSNIDKYKIAFFLKLSAKEVKILQIKLQVEINFEKGNISKNSRNILYSEINANLKKISFLKEVFDIEAKKVDPSYDFKIKKIDYSHYNKIFFGISKVSLSALNKSQNCPVFTDNIQKNDLLEIIKYSQEINPHLLFKFGKYTNFSHGNGVIKISEKPSYNIQNLISIFFHETTHFFRYYNGIKNFGFNYSFIDYTTLEEGISLYNEYFYGNRITNYGKFYSYYDECYKILILPITENEKIEKIYQILKCKGYSRKKSLGYYYRFYRFGSIGSNQLFLKDLIYTKAYNNVGKLLKKSPENYDKIMSGKIGLNEIKKGLYTSDHNSNSKEYFEKMCTYIIKFLKEHE